MHNRKFALAGFVFCFVCTAVLAQRLPASDESRLARLAREGAGTIAGKISLRARSGELPLRAGSEVILTAVTPYTTFVHDALIAERRIAVDARLARYERKTLADADGNFVFRNVPAGEYYLRCLPRWQVKDEAATISGSSFAQARAVVADGETVHVTMTR